MGDPPSWQILVFSSNKVKEGMSLPSGEVQNLIKAIGLPGIIFAPKNWRHVSKRMARGLEYPNPDDFVFVMSKVVQLIEEKYPNPGDLNNLRVIGNFMYSQIQINDRIFLVA